MRAKHADATFKKGDKVRLTKFVMRAILKTIGTKIDRKGEVIKVYPLKRGVRVAVLFPDYPGPMVCNPGDLERVR